MIDGRRHRIGADGDDDDGDDVDHRSDAVRAQSGSQRGEIVQPIHPFKPNVDGESVEKINAGGLQSRCRNHPGG